MPRAPFFPRNPGRHVIFYFLSQGPSLGHSVKTNVDLVSAKDGMDTINMNIFFSWLMATPDLGERKGKWEHRTLLIKVQN